MAGNKRQIISLYFTKLHYVYGNRHINSCFHKNMVWPLQLDITFNSTKFLDEITKINENTFVTKQSQALHCTWKFRAELNSKEQQIRSAPSYRGQEQNNIFARCICSSLCDKQHYQVYCFMPFLSGIFDCQTNLRYHFCSLCSSLRNLKKCSYTSKNCGFGHSYLRFCK